MTSKLDLILLPLLGYGRQDQQKLPGLHIANPPRRSARGRDRDRLILYLTQAGNALLSADQIDQLLTRLAQTFFKSPGSVTAAQRAVADALNQYLLERNLRNTSSGQQSIGILTQVVLRSDRLWLAQSGPSHVFAVTTEDAQHLYDLSLAGRGLGLSRTTRVRFSQFDLDINDGLILTPQPQGGWTAATLHNAKKQGPGHIRRYLLTQSTPHAEGVLIQVQKGTHKIHLLRPVKAQRPRQVSPELHRLSEEEPLVDETSQVSDVQALPEEEAVALSPEITSLFSRVAEETSPIQPPLPPGKTAVQPAPPVDRIPASAQKTRRISIPRPNLGPLSTALAVIGRAFANTGKHFGAAAGTLLRQMLPDAGILALPASTMAFVAVAVPLLVVVVSLFVYFERGNETQHQIYLSQAVQAAQQAQALEDPQELRLAWGIAVSYLDQADSYRRTDESNALRTQAQEALDGLNYVERVDFQLALTDPLKEDAQISRMVAEESDLYMLNSTEGVVLRATSSTQGYVLDPTFQCGPGPFGGYIVGSIVDIAPIPRSTNNRATVLGIDANGNLLYCIPGEAPLALPMAPPDTNWGSPKGAAQDSGDLYILDPLTNAVWIYRGLNVTQQPRLFFGEQIPTMQDVIDLTINRNDLYLLHEDGQITTCIFSGLIESPTRCEDPAIFTDPRPGLEDGVKIQDARFSEIQFAPPPDPSIYLLDPEKSAIYHFSVRLTLQRQYQSSQPLPDGRATSFAVNRGNRSVFLALGNQIFNANLP